ncbi:MAG: DUF4062 domain-containing protein [Hymenobacter sp.]|nr:MAG: DUF4062 domain-containing protein [Hymenobacter sp.]
MAKRLTVMVSSSVYGNRGLLDRVENTLAVNYKVWMSDAGSLPTDSRRSPFEDCLEAVRACDVFVGIITSSYGSGTDGPDTLGITHQEMLLAQSMPDKPRFMLVDGKVVLARQLLRPYRLPAGEGPFRKVGKRYHPIEWPRKDPMKDLRVIDLYEDMILAHSKLKASQRKGTWVHEYNSDEEAIRYLDEQLGDVKKIQKRVAGTSPTGLATEQH